MPKLTEKNVETIAVEFLRQKYARSSKIESVYSRQQMHMARRYRWRKKGTADGFVAARHVDGSIVTSCLEAKSHKTIGHVVPKSNSRDDASLLIHASLIACIALVASIGLAWETDSWIWRWFFPSLVALLAFVAYIAVAIGFLETYFATSTYRRVGMIRQIIRYPANERWLAISIDASNQLSDDDKRELFQRLDRYGIGLLVVHPRQKTNIVVEPSFKKGRKGNEHFLNYYTRGEEVLQSLNAR